MIYLDHQSTTPVDSRVLEAMLPWWGGRVGNAHSHHAAGRAARDAIEIAREQVARLIGAQAEDIIFTSGATEASNLALRGWLRKGHHAVTTSIEHSCVRDTLGAMGPAGVQVTEVQVSPDGLVDADAVAGAFQRKSRLVSVMAVNNEVGTVQPVAEIGSLCRAHDIVFHTDAAQAVGKIPLNVASMKIDMMSISAHKLYGPQGIGALYCRKTLQASLAPVLTGGGQERGLRSGTLPTALCVGFGAASRIAAAEMQDESQRLLRLRTRFLERLSSVIADVQVNGTLGDRIPGNLNLVFAGVDAEALLCKLDDVALSTGSACSSAALTPSHVLLAMGLSSEAADSSVRIGFGRATTPEEVDRAVDRIAAAVEDLRFAVSSRRVAAKARRRRGL